MTTLESTWKLLKVFMLNFFFSVWFILLRTKVIDNIFPNLPTTLEAILLLAETWSISSLWALASRTSKTALQTRSDVLRNEWGRVWLWAAGAYLGFGVFAACPGAGAGLSALTQDEMPKDCPAALWAQAVTALKRDPRGRAAGRAPSLFWGL